MSWVAHDVNGTTYYACPECGTCPCPLHRHEMAGHAETCSHRVPDEWWREDCTMMGPGKFVWCSACRYPPCHREITPNPDLGPNFSRYYETSKPTLGDRILGVLVCGNCLLPRPIHWLLRANGICDGRNAW